MSEQILQGKQKLFDRWAPNYDCLLTTVFYQAVHKRMLEFVELPPNSHILDLGCGTGRLLARLCQQFPDLTGVGLDFSSEMLHQARLKNYRRDRVTFQQGQAQSLPFTDNSFDAVFNSISFLHYPEPERVLREVYRVLRPNSHFYLADYTVREDALFNTFPFSPGGLKFYSPQKREILGQNAGFNRISHHYLLGNVLLSVFRK